MNVFIFQSVLDRFDLRKSIRPEKRDTWYATRYRNEMHPGDPVFFWMAGDETIRGLYGWGHITSDPYLKADWDGYGVDITYDVKFEKPILAKSIRDDAVLGEMLIFRAPQATNFLLSPRQAKQLVRLVKGIGQIAPSAVEAES